MADNNPVEWWKSRLTEADEWRRQMANEVASLPQTIADLREAIADLRKLIGRLEVATSGMEIMLRHAESSGMMELARKVDEATTTLEQTSRAGVGLAGAALDEFQKNLTGAADIIARFSGLKTDDEE